MAFEITDLGRVALGGSMGPGIKRVNGRLKEKDGDDYLVAVSGIELLVGGFQSWAGEEIRLKPTWVSTVYNKQFSKGRTVAFVALAAVATVAIAKSVIPASAIDQPVDTTPQNPARRGRIPFRPGLKPVLPSYNPPRSF